VTRSYLVHHLIENDCYPDEECDSEVSQLWHNAVNGESCYVPYEDELILTTYCHIFYELRIPPPLDFDADFDIYTSFREVHFKNVVKKNQDRD
jgi:hypothetical protein